MYEEYMWPTHAVILRLYANPCKIIHDIAANKYCNSGLVPVKLKYALLNELATCDQGLELSSRPITVHHFHTVICHVFWYNQRVHVRLMRASMRRKRTRLSLSYMFTYFGHNQ